MSLMMCRVGSGSGGRNSSRPASYMVRRWLEWVASKRKKPTEGNVVSAGGFGFFFAPYISVVVVASHLTCSTVSRTL